MTNFEKWKSNVTSDALYEIVRLISDDHGSACHYCVVDQPQPRRPCFECFDEWANKEAE